MTKRTCLVSALGELQLPLLYASWEVAIRASGLAPGWIATWRPRYKCQSLRGDSVQSVNETA